MPNTHTAIKYQERDGDEMGGVSDPGVKENLSEKVTFEQAVREVTYPSTH